MKLHSFSLPNSFKSPTLITLKHLNKYSLVNVLISVRVEVKAMDWTGEYFLQSSSYNHNHHTYNTHTINKPPEMWPKVRVLSTGGCWEWLVSPAVSRALNPLIMRQGRLSLWSIKCSSVLQIHQSPFAVFFLPFCFSFLLVKIAE